MDFFWYALALLAGMALATQAGINSQLRQAVGHPLLASLISFAVGLLSLLGAFLATRSRYPLLPFQQFGEIAWWKWTGGLLGAYMVSSAIFVAPRIGAANMIALIVAGQMLLAIVYDHFGLMGFLTHPVNPLRIIGAVLLLAGVWLILKS